MQELELCLDFTERACFLQVDSWLYKKNCPFLQCGVFLLPLLSFSECSLPVYSSSIFWELAQRSSPLGNSVGSPGLFSELLAPHPNTYHIMDDCWLVIGFHVWLPHQHGSTTKQQPAHLLSSKCPEQSLDPDRGSIKVC